MFTPSQWNRALDAQQRRSATREEDPLKGNRYLNATHHIPRPDASARGFERMLPSELTALQAEWDAAEKHRLDLQRFREEGQARADRERQEAIDAVHREANERQKAAELDRLKAAYLSAPGATAAAWERDKDEVLRQAAIGRAVAGSAAPDLVEQTKRELQALRRSGGSLTAAPDAA
ncbi:MAG: hypothetical protein QOJ59_577 [Thermomicrobiales bacterium]|jgi:hypothetical protein|nr:hypothetical protein [Thermomicrobiales bacterium]